jgi:integrase
MATGRINLTSLKGLDGWLADTAVTGFLARRQTNGVFFYCRYRHGGKQITKSIGRLGILTPDTARAKARELLGVVASGRDPFAVEASGDLFGIVVERYLARRQSALRPKSFFEISRYLRVSAAPLHNLPLNEINRRRIALLLGEIEDQSGGVTRNRCRSALSTLFTWAIREGYVDVNPVAGTGMAKENGGRERVLSEEEIRALWRGLGDSAYCSVVKLLLLTGQRRNEIGALRWSEVDLTANVIMLDGTRTKNHRAHTIPLSRQAKAIIEAQPRRNSTDYVFGYVDYDREKIALDARINIKPFVIHDLRRTASTNLGELGVLPHVIEAILNHQSGSRAGVAGIYNRSKLVDPMRDALQLWADHLTAITTA